MKILFINQYYWPDYAATSQMLADLAEYLASASGGSHEVHVLCSRGKYDAGSRAGARLPPHEIHRGVHVHRIAATGFAKTSHLGRVVDYASFHLLMGLRTLLAGRRYDVIVTLTTPPLVGIYATAVKTLTRTRHVCWVMDLHPDCEFELGMFSRRALAPRLLDWLNGLHFRRASGNVVLGEHMAERLRGKRVADAKLHVIPVWGHEQSAPADDGPNQLRKELQLGDRFVVMYSGNAGLVHTFDAVCETALRLRDDPGLVFLFVGGGRRMAEVALFKDRYGLGNIRLLDYFPREQLVHSLPLGNAHLITLRDGMAGIAVPSKLYGIMAASRPVLFVGPHRCETADTIRDADCGRCVGAGDVDGLIATLAELRASADLRRRLGENGRKTYERAYAPAVCCGQWRKLLESLRTRSSDD